MTLENERKSISIIVPFYYGNRFLSSLLKSIEMVEQQCNLLKIAEFEIIIINDSPEISITLPDNYICKQNILLFCNSKNMGIHATRVRGLEEAHFEWIIFLDQDDELVAEGFEKQLFFTRNSDVVVGNGLYQKDSGMFPIYKTKSIMKYCIRSSNFYRIRNLIPSPGQCLIKKNAIPRLWIEENLKENGADDWLLWLLMFNEEKIFSINHELVYVHNNVNGSNLSLDINKMYKSSSDMFFLLRKSMSLSKNKLKVLKDAIDFKYYQDIGQLTIKKIPKYYRVIIYNVIYKINIALRRGFHY